MTNKKLLWTLQAILALLFLFAGGMKLVTPVDELARQSPMPVAFLRFIGACEVLGAVGLIAPVLTGVMVVLTPLAALGLAVIMAGAVIVTVLSGPAAAAAIPLVVGALAAAVGFGRYRLLRA
jgi:hypothetical protein